MGDTVVAVADEDEGETDADHQAEARVIAVAIGSTPRRAEKIRGLVRVSARTPRSSR